MRYKPYIQTVFFATVSMILVICLIRYPQTAFDSALRGLKIWWDVVFPACLPFMILSEMMMGFGVVHFMGVLLEPLMRPLFNVPGAGGFVMSLGFASGYPVGPKLAARLREQKLVSRAEGERLLCFTSTTDPLFIFGAVAVGFFQDASLGISIALANYLGAIILGILLRYHDRKGAVTSSSLDKNSPLLLRAFRAMHRARLRDRRPLGKLMGDAVLSSFQTLFVIGGFIIIFSVIIKFVSMGAFAELLTWPLSILLYAVHIPEQMSEAFIIGFFEVTQSMQFISQSNVDLNMEMKMAITSGLLAWGGISVHAQVASIISSTDMRYQPYFIWKGIHSILAGIIAYLLWEPLERLSIVSAALPAFTQQQPDGGLRPAWDVFQQLGTFAFILLLTLILFSMISLSLQKIVRIRKR